MSYGVEIIDMDRFEEELQHQKKYQENLYQQSIDRAKSFYEGYKACLDNVQMLICSSDYEDIEKKTKIYRDGADYALYEICKELDINSQDIREQNISIDQKCSLIAKRIEEILLNQ